MGKILVVGPNSYIAGEFIKSLPTDAYVSISVRDDGWKMFDYSTVDTIVYFAAIVHHPEIDDEALYNNVNANIPYDMALMAAKRGVKRFIYISTVAVFGNGPEFGKVNPITVKTPLNPTSLYGKSKLKGETLLSSVEGITLQIVRLPNVYGEACPGTFYHRIEMLSRFKWLPSDRHNFKFSLISVENVAKALNRLIEINHPGVFIPQDTPILSIIDRIKNMARAKGNNQGQINMWPVLWICNKVFPKKYTNNLYGGYYIDPEDFPVLTD